MVFQGRNNEALIRTMPIEDIGFVLRGIFDTEGSVTPKSHVIRVATISEKGMAQVSEMLRLCGVGHRLYLYHTYKGTKIWGINIHGKK